MTNEAFEEILVDLEKGLSLPSGFLKALLSQDDWSFIIKAHALVESALTYMLASTLDPRLSDIFARINVGGRSGKLAFLEALDLLDEGQRGFIRKLSELRNSVAHDVKNANFTFEIHIANLTAEQKSQFTKFAVYWAEYQSDPAKKQAFVDGALSHSKFNLWWGMIGVLLHTYSQILHANATKSEVALNAAIAKAVPAYSSSPGAA